MDRKCPNRKKRDKRKNTLGAIEITGIMKLTAARPDLSPLPPRLGATGR